jgi:hypothetical protein
VPGVSGNFTRQQFQYIDRLPGSDPHVFSHPPERIISTLPAERTNRSGLEYILAPMDARGLHRYFSVSKRVEMICRVEQSGKGGKK